MKPNLLLYFLLLWFLRAKWSLATSASHAAEGRVQQPPQLLQHQPVQGLNATVRLSGDGDGDSGRENMQFDTVKWRKYSKKGGFGGRGRISGAGSQSLHPPHHHRSNSPSTLQPRSSLSPLPLLLLFALL
ncbi:hypothetical protein C4D60_Mb04t12480 [Musa balbisiana]|uniref:Uncharacterized protein n=1 Tax=Musa balbisiana TaxID=52838 RepID=A0A4S8KBH9_MUSBA|nr:hypothetical protein C4D60_Mb04t12480 [Musa balbisiana]